jgi:choline dehydrogenase-like flavoprotein
MRILNERWEPDGLDALPRGSRYLAALAVTGVWAFVLEYLGTQVLRAFYYTHPLSFYAVIALFAFLLGPLLVVLRKASVLVPMAVVGGLMFVLELWNHYHVVLWDLAQGAYVRAGESGPRPWEWRNGTLFGLRHPLLIATAAGLIETLIVPVSLWTLKLVVQHKAPKGLPKLEEKKKFFAGAFVAMNRLKPKRDFGFLFLRVVFLAYGIYFCYLVLGLLVNGKDLPLMGMYFLNPAQALNSFAKLLLVLLLANVGAFNPGIRREATIALTLGHLTSVAASLGMYLGYAPNPFFPADHAFLLSSVIADGVMVVIALFVIFKPGPQPAPVQMREDLELNSMATTVFRKAVLALGVLWAAYAVFMLGVRIFAAPDSVWAALWGGPDPLVSNSLTKYMTLFALSLYLYNKPGLRKYFVPVIALAFTATVAAALVYSLQGATQIVTPNAKIVAVSGFMPIVLVIEGGILALVLALRRFQYYADYQVTSLKPGSAECVMALHLALRETSQAPEASTREVLRRIDEHISEIYSRRRGLFSFPFWLMEHVFPTLLLLRPQFSMLAREEARWALRRYILRSPEERASALLPQAANLMFQIGEVCNSLVTLAYFSSATGQAQAGYILPDARERLQGDYAKADPPEEVECRPYPKDQADPIGKKPVNGAPTVGPAQQLLAPRIGAPSANPALPVEADYCIIGSGAAGGVLAYRLAQEHGASRSICVLERGAHFSPLQDFNDDELRMTRMLYTEGGLQTTRSFDFPILQAECVGGTTVVNNAVCFKMPEVAAKEWAQFGIEREGLEPHYERVKTEINIDTLRSEAVNQMVESLFKKGVEGYNALGLGSLSPAQRVDANFSNCLGCGLCNLGCKRMRKLSVLETYLPWSQGRGATIHARCGAAKCEYEESRGRKKITAVIVRRPNGELHRLQINKALIVAAGAIASSRFLMRSNLGGKHVGEKLSCNYAVGPVVEFEREIAAFDGLQITMFAAPDSFDAIFETTYNPPGVYALNLPVHFGAHAEVIAAYRRSANFAALVGSDPNGEVKRKRDLVFGRGVDWQQSEADLRRLRQAFRTIVKIAQAAGARRIWLPTRPPLPIALDGNVEDTLAALDRMLADKSRFGFITAHPQGGNLMASAARNERVIELDFRVRDCENLYVCDASVFPAGVRVNPQWTIMALASQAGEMIAANT